MPRRRTRSPRRSTRLRTRLLRRSRSAPRAGARRVSQVRTSPSFASPSLAARHSLSALAVARAMCAAPAAVDAAAAMPPRQAAAAGAKPAPRHARPFSWITCVRPLATHRLHAIAVRLAGMRRRAISHWHGAATKKYPVGAADARRRAPLPRRGPRAVRPTATAASKGPLAVPSSLAAIACQPCNLSTLGRVAACTRARSTARRSPTTYGSLALRCVRRARGTIAPL